MSKSKSLVEQASFLFELETDLQVLFRNEVGNALSIGAILDEIRTNKLYRYKDASVKYTWDMWCGEFFGSHDTAERFIILHQAFKLHKSLFAKAKTIPITKLYLIAPLLLQEKNKRKAERFVAQALLAPSVKELRMILRQHGYSLEQLTVEGEHKHTMMHRHYLICSICEKRKACTCPKISIKA